MRKVFLFTIVLFEELEAGLLLADVAHLDLDAVAEIAVQQVDQLIGEDDPVGGMGAGVRQTYQAFRHAGVADCTLKLYPGLRHELLNEKAHRTEVYETIWNWMEARVK